jgi:hypothetical protein
MPQYQDRSVMVDIPGIRQDLVSGGIARQVAPHPMVLKGSSESTKWYWQNDKNYLRYVSSFDQGAFRSDSASIGITLNTPGIQDGLHYNHYELEAIQGDIIPLDERQRAVSRRFMKAEDRIFFAGPDPGQGVASGTAGNIGATQTAAIATVNAAAEGVYAGVTTDTELDLTTDVTGALTMAGMIGQIRANLDVDSLKNMAGVLVVTADVKERMEGYKNANTDKVLEDTILGVIARAFSSATILTTNMLGAALDLNNQEITVTAGTTNALLMAVDGNSFVECRTSPLITRKEEGPISGLNIAIEEKYVPIFKQPRANCYSATVDITS